jgi:hypothetical protein
MKNFLFSFLTMLIAAITSQAQNPLVKQWDYSYGGYDGDFLYHLLPTPDGGFLASGISTSDATFEKSQDNYDNSLYPTYDCWLIKCSTDGVKEWDKTLGGTNDEFFYSIITTKDGGYLMAASSRSPASGDISQQPIGDFDEWVVKLDAVGNIQWEKRYGGSANNGPGDLVQCPDGGYLLCGYTTSSISGDVSQAPYGNADYWILRIDSIGNKLWDKRYGGNQDESVYKVFKTNDGGFLLAGSSFSGISGVKTQANYVNGASDLWFVKIDSLGNFQWDKVIGSLDDDLSMDMFQTNDQHYMIAAVNYANAGADKTEDTYGVDDFWVMRTDSLLNIIWDHSVGGNSNEDEFGNIYLAADGNILVAGTSYSDPGVWKSEVNNGPENSWVVLLDSAGNKIWDKTILTGYTHCELGLAVQLQDGCYLFANDGDGFTDQEKTDQSYSFDYWCIKFCDTSAISQPPSSGVNFGTIQQEICEKFCTGFVDSSSNNPFSWMWLFPGGSPSSSTEQNPSQVCYNIAGMYDVTLITTSADGNDTLSLSNFITVFATPPLPVITQNGYVLSSSPAFTYQWQLNATDIPGATDQSYTVLQTGLYSVVVSNQLGCKSSSSTYVTITGMDDVTTELLISVYPNPSTGIITLSMEHVTPGNFRIGILNTIGKIIYSATVSISSSSFSRQIDLTQFPEGMYYLKLDSPLESKIVRILYQQTF